MLTKRFKFLAQKMSQQNLQPTPGPSSTINDASCQVSKYLCEVEDRSLSTAHLSDPLRFWADRENIYDKLSLVAEDIISAPAIQAYVERVFSVCGMLTTGHRNRMTKSLEMTACLKLNRKVLATTGFYMPQWTILFELELISSELLIILSNCNRQVKTFIWILWFVCCTCSCMTDDGFEW